MRDGVGGEPRRPLVRHEHLALVVLAHGDFQKVHRAFHNHALHRRSAGLVVVVTLRTESMSPCSETLERVGAHRESATKRRWTVRLSSSGTRPGRQNANQRRRAATYRSRIPRRPNRAYPSRCNPRDPTCRGALSRGPSPPASSRQQAPWPIFAVRREADPGRSTRPFQLDTETVRAAERRRASHSKFPSVRVQTASEGGAFRPVRGGRRHAVHLPRPARLQTQVVRPGLCGKLEVPKIAHHDGPGVDDSPLAARARRRRACAPAGRTPGAGGPAAPPGGTPRASRARLAAGPRAGCCPGRTPRRRWSRAAAPALVRCAVSAARGRQGGELRSRGAPPRAAAPFVFR